MIAGSVNERLEYAILAMVTSYQDGEHQDYWAAWETAVTRKMQGCIFTHDDLRWAFENLADYQNVAITKPDASRKHAIKYSPAVKQGLADIDSRSFFLTGPFNVTITPSGRRHWKTLLKTHKNIMGFPGPKRASLA